MFQVQSSSWKPRSFQETGVKIGVSQACAGFLLAPGLGKTTIIYAVFKILKDAGFIKRMLVICPLKPAYNVWPKQKDKWDEFKDLRVCVLHGKNKEQLLASNDYDIYVINPEGLPWLFSSDAKGVPSLDRKSFIKNKFDVLCVDESTKFKDTSTARFKLLRRIVPVFKRRYILTGTFTPTGLEDLFGQIFILDEGATLGQYITHYRARYFHTQPWDKYTLIPNVGAVEEVGDKIASLVLRVSRKEIPDLPNLIFDDRYVDMPEAAMTMYLEAERDLLIKLEAKQIVAANAAVASSKCRQIANGFVYDQDKRAEVLHDEKMKELKNLIDELQGEPLIVTYEFEQDRDMMIKELGAPCISTGNTRKDDETIERFRRGAYPVVIGSTASISLGIDGLQDVCGHMAMFGVTWKLVDYLQVIDRIRRQGSSHTNVVIHRILARGTVDERVVQRLHDREEEMVDFMDLLQSMRGR